MSNIDFLQIDGENTQVSLKDKTKDKKNGPQELFRFSAGLIEDEQEAGRRIKFHKRNMYQFDGKKYVQVEDPQCVVRKMCILRKFFQSKNGISEIIENLKTVTSDSLDSEFDSKDDFVVLQNGILNISTGKMQKHTDKMFNTCVLPFNYDAEAKCEVFLQWINSILPEKSVQLLQEYFGYCMIPNANRQKFLLIQGPPRAGKGTLLTLFRELIGESNREDMDLSRLANRFGLPQLENKRVCVVDEIAGVPAQLLKPTIEVFNRITGQSPVTVERKGKDAYSLLLDVKFVLSCNSLPNFMEPTGAMSSRMLAILMKKSFADNPDPNLIHKLTPELSGIFNWALEGLKRLNENNAFTIAEPDFMESIREDSSKAYAFSIDCLELHPSISTGHIRKIPVISSDYDPKDISLPAADLMAAYDWWCGETGNDPSKVSWIIKELKALLGVAKGRTNTGGSRKVTYYGLRLQSEVASAIHRKTNVDELVNKIVGR